MKIPKLIFNSESDFTLEMSKHAYKIHCRTLYAIAHAYNTNEDYVTIAIIQTGEDEAELGCPDDAWIDNLEKSLDYFEEIEDYTKCQEVVQLIKKLDN